MLGPSAENRLMTRSTSSVSRIKGRSGRIIRTTSWSPRFTNVWTCITPVSPIGVGCTQRWSVSPTWPWLPMGSGGGPAGEEASRLALEAVSQYVSGSMDCYYTADPTDDQAFTQALADAAQHHHHRGAGGTKRRVKVGSRLPTWKPEGWKPAGRGRYSVRFREAGRSPAWPATSSRLQSRQHLTHIVVRSRCLWRIRWLLRGWVAESG